MIGGASYSQDFPVFRMHIIINAWPKYGEQSLAATPVAGPIVDQS
jgi:hypothetical protein